MGYLYLFVVLTIQATIIYASPEAAVPEKDVPASREVLQKPEEAVELVKGPEMDWIHMFSAPSATFPAPAAMLMSKITSSDKSPEEQCEAIKHMAAQISSMMNAELIEVMNMFMENCEKETVEVPAEETKKSKRSVETPFDSSQRLMRLLRHIKTNNENQNVAIEKLMTAQEIADKFGIDFTPEPEVLYQLETQTTEHANELNEVMKDTSANNNITEEQVTFIPLEADQHPTLESNSADNSTYYVYSTPEQEIATQFNAFAPYEYKPDIIQKQEQTPNEHHAHHSHHHNHHNHNYHPQKNHFPESHNIPQNHYHSFETQMIPPPVQQPFYSPPVTPKPSYYDIFTPAPEFFSPIMFEPMTTTTTIILPIEEIVEVEPELVGEEYEETVSSKVTVDHAEPGESTVNHVMTYTVAEKTHFKAPEIEKLPQQMQYSFFLM